MKDPTQRCDFLAFLDGQLKGQILPNPSPDRSAPAKFLHTAGRQCYVLTTQVKYVHTGALACCYRLE